MEKYNTQKKIEQKIRNKPKGTVFVISDFSDLGSNDAIRKALSRLVKEGKLKRELRGIYKKPNFNEFIKEEITSSPKEIAYAHARAYGWEIIPSGNTALNELGLSTQVPNVNTFISDGPSKTIEFNHKTTIKFKKITNREISNVDYKSALLIEALKALKKENITDDILDKIRKIYSEEELKKIKKDTKRSRSWIYEEILKL